MIVFPNTKVNIGLYVTGKRSDGFHNIESIFYPVGWSDALEVAERSNVSMVGNAIGMVDTAKHRLFLYGNDIPGDASENLCLKIVSRLEDWFNLPDLDIHLLKNIPIGSGLGGGSADAAFCLRALKEYFDLTISDVEAMEMLATIGSDCPYFWSNKPAFVFGKGDNVKMHDLKLNGNWIVLVYPGIPISTKEAYQSVHPSQPPIDLNLLADIGITEWKELVYNDFQVLIAKKYPEIDVLCKDLYELGAMYASMSGSGSTCYGIFSNKPEIPNEWRNKDHWIGML